VVVRHLVPAAHDVAQGPDGGLLVGLLQLVDVGRTVGIIPALHHGLDEHRHDHANGPVVLDEGDGRVGHAPVVVGEGGVKVVEVVFRRNCVLALVFDM